MKFILDTIKEAQGEFRSRLELLEKNGRGITAEAYAAYLSMQYHLTNGVQRHFITAASHPDLAHRRSLRKFLVDFANEEEMHYEIAAKDLEYLGQKPADKPIDVALWWAYFDSIIYDRPFIRLGATCILENISSGSNDVIDRLFKDAKFLTPKNSRFFAIHRHDSSLPHGDQIIAALQCANLEERHLADLEYGARVGKLQYLRMVDQVFLVG